MLKIKDYLDLKELEKFGFFTSSATNNWYIKDIRYNQYEGMGIFIRKDTRIIKVETYGGLEVKLNDTLYDLIKADMVEKVEE